ncbi:MAG: hypothetical protein E6J34_00935 [Chloroflexi bacterium]|nr:MAG: hypothetical protein E6J34_00935 [Chloroflexota bacterium]
MYLKRLEMLGFKSFASRTVLEFSSGITAVVGPNGAGKSNVADSMRWVLGEQSMRQLRGKKSEDIIFAGGYGKSSLGMAEVSLTLDNCTGWVSSPYSEICITRRTFRSGENEYLINKQKVRLKDVLLLLAQARIGHDSYTVVGQGLIDAALSLRAEERRGLFEDAAGIRPFQVQRADAENRLRHAVPLNSGSSLASYRKSCSHGMLCNGGVCTQLKNVLSMLNRNKYKRYGGWSNPCKLLKCKLTHYV